MRWVVLVNLATILTLLSATTCVWNVYGCYTLPILFFLMMGLILFQNFVPFKGLFGTVVLYLSILGVALWSLL